MNWKLIAFFWGAKAYDVHIIDDSFLHVQASSIPSVLSGKDVIIAAETGSGKTYTYLVPLIDKLLGTQDHSLHTVSDKEVPSPRKVLLVLCPNVQLCEQVVRMANSLCGDNGEPIVSVAAICGRQVVMLWLFYFLYFSLSLCSYRLVWNLLSATLSSWLFLYEILAFFSNFLCIIYNTKNLFDPGMASS